MVNKVVNVVVTLRIQTLHPLIKHSFYLDLFKLGILDMQQKECRQCKLVRNTCLFHKKKGGRLGVDSTCKHCISIQKRKKAKEKQIKERAKMRRRFGYKEELVAEPQFIDASSKQASEALNILLQSISSNLACE